MPRSPCRVDEQTPLSTGTVPPPAAGRAAAGHGRGGPGGGDALAGDLLPAGGAAGDRAAHVRVRADPPISGAAAGRPVRRGRRRPTGEWMQIDSTPLDVRVATSIIHVSSTWSVVPSSSTTRTIAAGCCARPPRQRAVFVATSGCPSPRNRGFDPSSSPVGERSRRLGDRPRLCEVYPLGQTLAASLPGAHGLLDLLAEVGVDVVPVLE